MNNINSVGSSSLNNVSTDNGELTRPRSGQLQGISVKPVSTQDGESPVARNSNGTANPLVSQVAKGLDIASLANSKAVKDFIKKAIDTAFFDKQRGLGLEPSYGGSRQRSGERSKTLGAGVSVDDARNFAASNGSSFGLGQTGRTLFEAGRTNTVGRVDRSVQGRFGSANLQGQTDLGVNGRVFGEVDRESRSARIGVEAQAGAQASYNGSLQSPSIDLAGQRIDAGAQVNASGFAGVAGRGEAGISLNGNAPRVNIGGELFAGARASVSGQAGVNINGRQVAEARGMVEGWAGVGAKGDIDIGIKDGKLNFDFSGGAALGLGGAVDVGFSVDVKAIAEGVENAVEDVVNDVAKRGVETVVNEVKEKAESVGNAIESGIKNAGKAASSFFKKIF